MATQTSALIEQELRHGLVRGDAALAAARPALRALVDGEGGSYLSEATVAQVRGMALDLASRLLLAQAAAGRGPAHLSHAADRQDELATALVGDDALLVHLHGLALEGQFALRLETQSGIDAVLPPLLQQLSTAGQDPALAGLVMALLAAQARFIRQFRRMELPLEELPADLLDIAASLVGRDAGELLLGGLDESASRLGLLARVVLATGHDAPELLSVSHAGVALFATALAAAAGQERELVLLSFADSPPVRLGLSMRAAGLSAEAIDAQCLVLRPEHRLPAGLGTMDRERAAAFLAAPPPEGAL